MFTLRSIFSQTTRRTEMAAWRLSFPLILGPINTEAVLAEIEKGVKHGWRDKNGETLLMMAVQAMQPDVVRRLVEKGADVNVAVKGGFKNTGKTALHLACEHGNKFSVEALLDGDADLSIKDAFGCTPLHYAATDDEKLQLLLRKTPDIDARDGDGFTALMRAARSSLSAEPVARLLAAGADVMLDDKNGHTALQFAAGNEYLQKDKIIALLEQAVAAREALREKQELLEMQKIAATIAVTKRDITVFRSPVRFRPA